MTLIRRIVLARPVEGRPRPDDFRLETFEAPPLEEGRFLVAHRFVSADPGTRSRLSGRGSYAGALAVGDVIDGFAVGEVVDSRHDGFPVGTRVTLGGGWASHSISNGRGYCAKLADLGVPDEAFLGALGVPGMTAFFGLKRVAEMKPGARVLVTSAAGPVGATAGQLARAFGASRVVGVAGGLAGPGADAAKRDWLTTAARFDALVDHADPAFDAALAAAMPEGVDVLFDNVGNAMIDRILPLMRPGGRIVVSGQVADYNVPLAERAGIRDTAGFIVKRLRMEGLVVFDDLKAFPAAQADVAALIRAGEVATRDLIVDGLYALPDAFCGLFESGAAFGRRLARV